MLLALEIHGKEMASTLNRSLERGIEILRAFRPGSALLGNGEIAERTGLSPATVSRLTQTLVVAGMLAHDRNARAYRLAAPVLSLAHAMRTGSLVLQAAAPLMRALAEKLRINVGLAVADRTEMVYLESIRYNRRASLRNVVSGQRVPIELTSLGRAWLAVAPADVREALYADFAARRADWPRLHSDIQKAIANVQQRGWCATSWQPEVVALATPLKLGVEWGYVLNVSVSSTESPGDVAAELHAPLLALSAKITRAVDARELAVSGRGNAN
ncbi:IclR family transcriptional regulator [Variovorax paradoxus]|uniref:HTH-type transcriptional regulator TsaQ1/TsaQ2 n=1 Tax=Variovorax paradoxus TaxID=34073 RepID=A0A679JW53_VARPD|nr:HTH-type transcriptional regulator TsaQ1/TsaQ2 [Variovorax paradoxus]